ncbi:MAG TPA: CopG family transcriptional regulator [Rhizomicrobium sp.]
MSRPVPEVSVFEPADDAAEEKALAAAEAEVDAGRFISHKAMRRWLLSWGKPNELPPPKCGE